jgi:hypothetical protein
MRSPLTTTGLILAAVVLPPLAYYAVPILVRLGYSTVNFIDHARWQELAAALITASILMVVVGDIIMLRREIYSQRRQRKNNGEK